MTDTQRLHRLAQAAQVADLVADRAGLLLELLEQPADLRSADLERLEQLAGNLRRSLAAYSELRAPV